MSTRIPYPQIPIPCNVAFPGEAWYWAFCCTYNVFSITFLSQEHKKKQISTPFKLNLHQNSLFDPNSFKSDKPLPPLKNEENEPSRKGRLNPPFKQSSPGKATGNCKAGTFTPYPEHPVDGYDLKGQRPPGPKYGVFFPSAGNKSRPTDSGISMHVTKCTNSDNFRTVKCSV